MKATPAPTTTAPQCLPGCRKPRNDDWHMCSVASSVTPATDLNGSVRVSARQEINGGRADHIVGVKHTSRGLRRFGETEAREFEMTPGEARVLAAELLRLADVAEGKNPRQCTPRRTSRRIIRNRRTGDKR